MKNYNIGLDIGTTSVGWAVIDDDYKVIRKNRGKEKIKLWGVRLFDDAKTAETRRLARGMRRRYARRRERICLLRKEFEQEINKVDSQFFQKLDESFYQEQDKENKKIILTAKEKEEIKKYYKKYPTIYHLRYDLTETKQKMDIRLIYLAIHHIIKYRGNFLYEQDNFNVSNLDIIPKCENVFNYWCDKSGILLEEIDFQELEKALLNSSKNDKKIEIKKVLEPVMPKNMISEFTKLILGNQFSMNKLLLLEQEEDIKISFKGSSYEEKQSEIQNNYPEFIEIIEELKELYDILFLKELFAGKNYTSISHLMKDRYLEHKNDLKYLKELFNYCSGKNKGNKEIEKSYKKIFRNKKVITKKEDYCSYEQYIRNLISYDEFIKIVKQEYENNKEYLEKIPENTLEKIENGNFLPRITDTDNGKYPYQLNKEELLKIIENQKEYYPFLGNQITINDKKKYKLERLLEFRIPYYVGPLVEQPKDLENLKNSKYKFSWMIRKKQGKITPYNFNEMIDLDVSAEQFIKKMLSHCTYLLDEIAMPNHSILYSKFKVLNELKQISIDGEKLSKELQEKIYRELFLTTSGTITEKIFKNYLNQINDVSMFQLMEIQGYSADKKFANNMQSYIDFFGKNGIFKDTSYTENDAETIIEWITIFEDKKNIRAKST